jgi:hypothetical protein
MEAPASASPPAQNCVNPPMADDTDSRCLLGVDDRAGFPVLPGWVLPAAEGRAALAHGAAALRAHGVAAGRRAILCQPVDPALAGELRSAATGLGGRVIVRSSSPLEAGPRWAGAFSSVAEVGADDIVSRGAVPTSRYSASRPLSC